MNSETVKRAFALVSGGTLTGLGAWYTWQHYGDAAAPLAAIVGAGMLHLAEHCWHERQRVRSIAMLGCAVGAAAISFVAVLDRVSASRDGAALVAESRNLAREQAAAALRSAEAELKDETAAARAECSRALPGRDPRGPGCIAAEQREERARARRDAARETVVQAGAVEHSDPGARRLSHVLPISEDAVRLYMPLLLPLWVELAGLVLLSFGLSRRRPAAAPRDPVPAAREQTSEAAAESPTPPARLDTPEPENDKPADRAMLDRLRGLAVDGRVTGTQRDIARRLGVSPTALNRTLAAARRTRTVQVDTANNATVIHFQN